MLDVYQLLIPRRRILAEGLTAIRRRLENPSDESVQMTLVASQNRNSFFESSVSSLQSPLGFAACGPSNLHADVSVLRMASSPSTRISGPLAMEALSVGVSSVSASCS